jgi:hypothetical protein
MDQSHRLLWFFFPSAVGLLPAGACASNPTSGGGDRECQYAVPVSRVQAFNKLLLRLLVWT